MIKKNRSAPLLATLAAASLLAGCSDVPDSYKADEDDLARTVGHGRYGPDKPVRVAVIEAEDERGRLFDDPPGSFGVMWIPLYFWSSGTGNKSDLEVKSDMRIMPATLAWDVVKRFRESGKFAKVDYNPSLREDYDIILRPKLDYRRSQTWSMYGLTCYGGIILYWLGLPGSWDDNHMKATWDIEYAGKHEAVECRYDEESSHGAYAWYHDGTLRPPLTAVILDSNLALAKKADELLRDGVPAEREQTWAYYGKLDPDIAHFREQLASAGLTPARKNDLTEWLAVKISLLGILRDSETDALAEEQKANKNYVETLLKEAEDRARQHDYAESQRAAAQNAAIMSMAGSVSAMNAATARSAGAMAMARTTAIVADAAGNIARAQEPDAAERGAQNAAKLAVLDEKMRAVGKYFEGITGDIHTFRQKWMRTYRERTPTCEEVVSGNLARYATSSAPAKP